MRFVSWNVEEIIVEFPAVKYSGSVSDWEGATLYPRFNAIRVADPDYQTWLADYPPYNYDPEGYGLK